MCLASRIRTPIIARAPLWLIMLAITNRRFGCAPCLIATIKVCSKFGALKERLRCTGARRRSILGRIIRMRRVLRLQRAHQNRILKLSIDEPQELGIDIACVEPHFVFSSVSRRRSNGPPIASTVHNISLRSNGAEIA
jgi:hypothetical protein